MGPHPTIQSYAIIGNSAISNRLIPYMPDKSDSPRSKRGIAQSVGIRCSTVKSYTFTIYSRKKKEEQTSIETLHCCTLIAISKCIGNAK